MESTCSGEAKRFSSGPIRFFFFRVLPDSYSLICFNGARGDISRRPRPDGEPPCTSQFNSTLTEASWKFSDNLNFPHIKAFSAVLFSTSASTLMSLAAARFAVPSSISSSEALQLSLRAFVTTKKKLIVYEFTAFSVAH